MSKREPMLSGDLPKGVVNSRLAAIKAERIETAKVIEKLERLVVDTENRLIRVRSILNEITSHTVKPMMLDLIEEAKEEIG